MTDYPQWSPLVSKKEGVIVHDCLAESWPRSILKRLSCLCKALWSVGKFFLTLRFVEWQFFLCWGSHACKLKLCAWETLKYTRVGAVIIREGPLSMVQCRSFLQVVGIAPEARSVPVWIPTPGSQGLLCPWERERDLKTLYCRPPTMHGMREAGLVVFIHCTLWADWALKNVGVAKGASEVSKVTRIFSFAFGIDILEANFETNCKQNTLGSLLVYWKD